MGTSFGINSFKELFNSSNSSNFMTNITSVLAAAFFIFSLLLGILIKKNNQVDNVQLKYLNNENKYLEKNVIENQSKEWNNDIP